jgi:hypothetical protein
LSDANALLMGTGVPSTKPAVINATVVLDPILDVEAAQQVDFKTRKPLFYDDRKPRMQIICTGQTTERDPAIDHDDGVRKLYIKGQMRQAVRDAVVAAGARGLERGGSLAVQWVGEEDAGPGMNPKKLFSAQYRRPPTGNNPSITRGPEPAQPQPSQAANLFAAAANADELI